MGDGGETIQTSDIRYLISDIGYRISEIAGHVIARRMTRRERGKTGDGGTWGL